jgi:hypothetical protein
MEECTNHFWGTRPNHEDGITYQQCLHDGCGVVAGPVMSSGTEWLCCNEGQTILPERPTFHDPQKEREWLSAWVETQLRNGGYVAPQLYEAVRTERLSR